MIQPHTCLFANCRTLVKKGKKPDARKRSQEFPQKCFRPFVFFLIARAISEEAVNHRLLDGWTATQIPAAKLASFFLSTITMAIWQGTVHRVYYWKISAHMSLGNFHWPSGRGLYLIGDNDTCYSEARQSEHFIVVHLLPSFWFLNVTVISTTPYELNAFYSAK